MLDKHPNAAEFPMAEFNIIAFQDIPTDIGEVYVDVAGKIVELGPVAGENDKVRRQVRMSGLEGPCVERYDVVLFDNLAEHPLLEVGKKIVLAGVHAGETLRLYSSLGSIMAWEEQTEEEEGSK